MAGGAADGLVDRLRAFLEELEPAAQTFEVSSACVEGARLAGVYWVPEPELSRRVPRWRELLTVTPESGGGPAAAAAAAARPLVLYLELRRPTAHYVGVPRFWGLRALGAPAEDRRVLGEPMGPGTSWSPDAPPLRPEQDFAREQVLGSLRRLGGAFVEADCGVGKTAIALRVAQDLRRRTLVLVHGVDIMTQWVEASRRWWAWADVGPGWVQGAPPGAGGRSKRFVVDRDLVIMSIDSAAQCRYDLEFYASFGLVIVDEAHILAARTVSTVLGRFPARYVLALSATPNRADGLGFALYWLAGPTAFRYQRLERVTGLAPTTRVVRWVFGMDAAQVRDLEVASLSEGHTGILKLLASWPARTSWIGRNVVRDLLRPPPEGLGRRKVILFSHFKDHVEALADAVNATLEALPAAAAADGGPGALAWRCGALHGGRRGAADKAFARGSVAYAATYALLNQAWDDPEVDTVVLATPAKGIQQAVGRAERPKADGRGALVVDVVDRGHYRTLSLARARNRWYRERGVLDLS